MKNKYAVLMIIGICSIVAGGIAFLLVKKEFVPSDVLMPYYPIFIAFIAIGIFILIRTLSVIDAYRILVKNEEHMNRLSNNMMKKVKKRLGKSL